MRATVDEASRLPWTRWLWVLVLVLTAAFQFLRGAMVEGVVFAVAAGVLALTMRSRIDIPLPIPAGWILVAGVGVVSLVLIVLPEQSPAMAIALLAIGAYVLPAGWGSGVTRRGTSAVGRGGTPTAPTRIARTRTLIRADVLWAVLAVLVCVWELSAFALGAWTSSGPLGHPTISALFEPLLEREPWRVLLTVAWVAGGAALLRRGRGA